ncbi:MAG: flavin reductase, partial [Actinomycetota bacterium]
LTYAVGSSSGRDGDKFARHGLRWRDGPVLGMPLLEAGCAAWLECRLIPEPHAEAHPKRAASSNSCARNRGSIE